MSLRPVPELLAPAGSLDAVRAAVANGANAVYLGAEKFNARDEGAQLTMGELREACALARSRGVRVYLTLNTLVKPGELTEALAHLGHCIDAGIDAAIVQDMGLVRLIQRVFPGFEVHGSTQMTVHDASGARLMRDLGLDRVVLAREITLDDVRAIRSAVPELGLETFVHGALCISYSGQCLMSGMISERSANRGACAQACRKDYVLTDSASGSELDRGYLISARDLAAHDHLAALTEIGIGCLKIEGRKKKPEYVATVTKGYRAFLDRVAEGEVEPPAFEDVRPLVQIYSRGFTGGMYGGRQGRDYITRGHPDNRGHEIGRVVGAEGGEIVVDVTHELSAGDGIAFEPPTGARGEAFGFAVDVVRTVRRDAGVVRQAVASRRAVPVGWRVVRSAEAALLRQARQSFAHVAPPKSAGRRRMDVRLFGGAGTPLKALFSCDGETVDVRSEATLAPARAHPLDDARLRDHLGRLGDTPFALGTLDRRGLRGDFFLPISELNHLRQRAVEELTNRFAWANAEAEGALGERIASAVAAIRQDAFPAAQSSNRSAPDTFRLVAVVHDLGDARAASAAGATEVVVDPFLRHPVPPARRVAELATELAGQGVITRLRLPTIVRPEERASFDKWLALGLPILTGHTGLAVELANGGSDVVVDYAVNCFNQHTAAELLARGVRRIVASVELTLEEIGSLVAPWYGTPFDVVVYGRPEGMTLEHCVLSAAFDREPTTCRDLCVKSHPVVELTDPAGYTFPVATDSACRNRLLHSRPIEGSEFLPRLWNAGVRGFHVILNVPGLPVADIVTRYRSALVALGAGERADLRAIRALVGQEFTRGHFVQPV